MGVVLLASADSAMVRLFSASIEAHGHRVHVCTDGLDATRDAQTLQPDLVLLDASLPVFDGYAACEVLRNDPEVSPTLPIFIVRATGGNPKRLTQAGGTGHVTRFPTSTELGDLLAKVLQPDAWEA